METCDVCRLQIKSFWREQSMTNIEFKEDVRQ